MNKNTMIILSVVVVIAIGLVIWKFTSKSVIVEENSIKLSDKPIQVDTTTKIDEDLNSINVDPNLEEDFKNLDKDLNNL